MRCAAGFHSLLLPRLIGRSALQYEANSTPPASVLVTDAFLIGTKGTDPETLFRIPTCIRTSK